MINHKSAENSLLTTVDKGVLHLTLNRPEKLNAFNVDMHLALRAALEQAAQDLEIRAVLLTGSGRGFCAGQDLGDRDPRKAEGVPDLGHTIEKYTNPLVRQIRALNKPVICAVNGVAAGAGANLALACDIVFAARSARFIQSFAKIGLIPDAGGTWSLAKHLGEARAKALALTATPLDATTAAEWGLIWQVVEDDKLHETATLLAQQFAQGATLGLGLIKQAIQASAQNSLDEQLDLERDLQRQAGNSRDYAEGVAAFLEKRTPNFRGN